ncbi:class I SAM-dependent methyltransferase [Candidatus Entotheonella palauensis]|uniref:class I SAM-dependent methyltransferase n=1 Tax=Candidatus Entotheonella palauensis TaxID=93172 RepID=UPI0015C4722F|nr:class I SAM-dependent methyltransferase [Candidatus Entotheonella palauensis]
MKDKQLAPPLDDDCYAEFYELRKAASTMTTVAIDWLRKQAGAVLQRKRSISEDQTFSVLSVGSGEGDIDIEFIRAFLDAWSPRWDTLQYVAIEPNAAHREGFLQRLDDISFDHRLNISVIDQRFEELDRGEHQKQYDLVLFVHVFYYFEDPKEVIQRALTLTKEGGQVVIVHQTPTGIPEIQQKYMHDIKGDENEMFTTADIRNLLDGSVERYQYHEIDAHLDVTECLRGTEAGLKIMSFCMECDLRKLHEAKVAQISRAFWNQAEIKPDGNAFIREPIGVFILESPPIIPDQTNPLADDDPVEDYRQLARQCDWAGLFKPKSFSPHQRDSGPLKLLDVACGTGRWLKAFLRNVPIQSPTHDLNGNRKIAIDVLDPSQTAISKIRDNILAPMQLGQQYITTLQKAELEKRSV